MTTSGAVRMTVLGSGDAFCSGGRANSAYLLEVPGRSVLLECGPTALHSLKRLAIDTASIDAVLLSHLHGDHFGGVPFLFLEYRYEQPRTRPLTIYGPPETERRVRGLFAALYERTATEPLPFPLRFVELPAGRRSEVEGIRVLPIETPHDPSLICYAYRMDVAGRAILFSGDTAWNEALVGHARGTDLFLCECSTYETQLPIHLSYPEIAARVADFGCRRLLLTHLGAEPLRHKADLSLECAEDGMTLEL
jgi:ribonuclease BN (tRNA processing enzyme)